MRLRLALIMAIVGVATLLSGCDPSATQRATVSSTPSPSSSAAGGPAVTSAGTAGPTDPLTTRSPARAAAGTERNAGAAEPSAAITCTATNEVLLAALRSDAGDIYVRAGRPAALEQATCYQDYAVARTVPDGMRDRVRILFRFDGGTASWKPINVGSGSVCDGVPTEVREKLTGCA